MIDLRMKCRAPVLAVLLLSIAISSPNWAQTLDQDLQRIPVGELARQAKLSGDAARGAVVFFQPYMACAKCHTAGKEAYSLGPDLTAIGKEVTDEHLVESVLAPSKVIRPGFESVTIVTTAGSAIIGLLVEQTNEKIVVRDVSRIGEVTTFAMDDIEEINLNTTSIMPAEQMNLLNSRQQFLDLIRYLIEIRDGGAQRAAQLQPSTALLAFKTPEYEAHLDHAGMIGDWNDEAFQRGEAIYARVCANCHGTKDKPGSLPTSLRFAEGTFKNGSDPLSMYRTLTYGFGLMALQSWMVPSQKYDVIHYIREAYLKPHNPTQWVPIDSAYLARLPKGNSRGPEPSKLEPWSLMDYGPSLTHTYEVPGLDNNLAYKGVAVRLDHGAGGVSRGRHWMIFDTDTLRMAAAWSSMELDNPPVDSKTTSSRTSQPKFNGEVVVDKPGTITAGELKNPAIESFIDWRGIQFNGEHGVHPRVVGQIAFANSSGPGWANPVRNDFIDDQRVLGRDGKRYGPLPHQWGRFQGLYYHGQQVVFAYTIGTTEILESPSILALDEPGATPLFLRTFNIGPRDGDLVLQIAEHSARNAQLQAINPANQSVVKFAPPQPGTAATRHQQERLNVDGNASSEIANDGATANHHDVEDRLGVGPIGTSFGPIVAEFEPSNVPAEWIADEGRLRLRISAGDEPIRFTVWQPFHSDNFRLPPANLEADRDLALLTKGGPPRWQQKLETRATKGLDDGPFAVDILTAPETNPWLAQTRFTGLDFFPDGRIAVCSWDGDVWIVTPTSLLPPSPQLSEQPTTSLSSSPSDLLTWQRITSGLFQPLGLKIVGNKIHVICRDQLAVLHDLNGDGEIDFTQCLNNDHQVTEHFHEFAMGLQTDAAGNFYYAKSGCHGKAAVVPHHGTLLRVARDGSRTDILANGFRATNGVCLNPDGSFVVTDQEGFWNPKNRINWVTLSKDGKPNFYGNMLGYHDVTDTSDAAMVPPLCWITNAFDRSPAELLWVDTDRWGPLKGSLLNLSYGYGKVYLVPHENVNGTMQGGMIELPLPTFPTGVMRGRFHPIDGQLYLCGMFAWAGNATHPGGLYRLRTTGQPIHLPTQLHASKSGLQLTFTEPLDPASLDIQEMHIKTWSLRRTAKYGSEHFDEKALGIRSAALSGDSRTLTLDIPDIQPTWCMEIKYTFRSATGTPIHGTIHNTIHELSD